MSFLDNIKQDAINGSVKKLLKDRNLKAITAFLNSNDELEFNYFQETIHVRTTLQENTNKKFVFSILEQNEKLKLEIQNLQAKINSQSNN